MTPAFEHEIRDGLHLIRITAPGRRDYRAELRECGCVKPPCRNDHVRYDYHKGGWFVSYAERNKCEVRQCHAWHRADIEAHIAAALRTYTTAGRRHRPSIPSRGWSGPTGKPETIAAHLGWTIDDVRAELAKASGA